MSSYLFTELLLHWATFSLTERPLCWGTSSLSYFFSELLHICSELRSPPATSSLSYFSSSVCNPILLFARVRFSVHIFFLKLSNLFLSQNRSIVCFICFCFIIIIILIIIILIIIIIIVLKWYQFLRAAMTIQFCSLQLQSGMATYNLFSTLQLQSRMAGASHQIDQRAHSADNVGDSALGAPGAPLIFFCMFPWNRALATVWSTFCRQLFQIEARNRGNTPGLLLYSTVPTCKLLPLWLTWWQDWPWTCVRNSEVCELNFLW